MTREEFISMATTTDKIWDVTIKSDYMNGVLMAATVTSTNPDQITIQIDHRNSITLDISESEIEVVEKDYEYSFAVAGITFTITESIF